MDGEGRHYHTNVHLFEMFEWLDYLLGDLPAVVVFAVLFHDVVYDAKSGRNEEDSAEAWRMFFVEVKGLAGCGGDSCGGEEVDGFADKVYDYIIQTKAHKVLDNSDGVLQAFIDADMAVLGKRWDAYLAYSKLVRLEYAYIPDADFRVGRCNFLKKTVEGGGRIFATETMYGLLEERAKENMGREGEMLLL